MCLQQCVKGREKNNIWWFQSVWSSCKPFYTISDAGIDLQKPVELILQVNRRISATKHVHLCFFTCRYWFRLRGWSVGLSLYTVTCPLITDYHRLFVLWPVAVYKISHRSWRMLGNSLSRIQLGTGIFGKSNFISTNMRKMKTNTTQTANYHPLGPLSPVFPHRDTKWPTALHRAQIGRKLLPFPLSKGQPRSPG